MKYFLLAFIFSLALPSIVFSQAAAPIYTVCSLPAICNESSGIEKIGPNRFLSHNDSGGQPDLYEFDSSGVLLKTLKISNATNIDWEDLAQDDLGNVYIGDFGNNNNNRSALSSNGLKIYKITNPNLITGTTTVAGVINFEYVDRNFSAPATNHNFDMEGFFFFNDSLHLFTKNRTNPNTGYIKHYILPSVAGTYTAALVDSFFNSGVRITSADISPNKKTVVLQGEYRIYLFQCFKGSKFISTGTNLFLTVPITQKEAVVFSNDSLIYITDELNGANTLKLYRVNMAPFIYKPLSATSIIKNTCPATSAGSITFTPSGGVGPFTYNWSNSATTAVNSALAAGMYSIILTDSKGCVNNSTFTVNNFTVVTPVITQAGNLIVSNSSSANQWYFNSGVLGGQTNDTLMVLSNGNYYSVVTDANGCVATSNTINYSSVDIKELNKSTISCYYNGNAYVVENKSDFEVKVELCDLLGRSIIKGKLHPGELLKHESGRQIIIFKINNEQHNFSTSFKRY